MNNGHLSNALLEALGENRSGQDYIYFLNIFTEAKFHPLT